MCVYVCVHIICTCNIHIIRVCVCVCVCVCYNSVVKESLTGKSHLRRNLEEVKDSSLKRTPGRGSSLHGVFKE